MKLNALLTTIADASIIKPTPNFVPCSLLALGHLPPISVFHAEASLASDS
jgi:hypothetical protein